MKINALQIMQIAQMGFGIFAELKPKQQGEKLPTREEIRAYILTSTTTIEAMGHLSVRDRKKWNKDIDKQVDLVLSMCANSEWK